MIVKGKDYRAPGVLAGSHWPGMQTLYDTTYEVATLKPRNLDPLTPLDFHHAYQNDADEALKLLQAKCLFAAVSAPHFVSDELTSGEGEQVDSEFSFSRISEIPTSRIDESWSKNTSKRRTISLLKGIPDSSSIVDERSGQLEGTLASFSGSSVLSSHVAPELFPAEGRVSVLSIDENLHENSSIIDEGSMAGGLRVFLAGTASHNCFTLQPLKFVKLPQKELSPLVTPHLTSSSFSFLPETGGDYEQSPLLRKLIICEQQRFVVELRLGVVCLGYQLALPLEFSNSEHGSRAAVRHSNNEDFAGLLYTSSLELLLQHRAISIACGYEHCVAVTSSGLVLSWGNGQSGCLGHGDRESRTEPTLVDGLRSVCVVSVDCGAYHTAAVTLDGGLWTWGRGDAGQLGLASERLERDAAGQLSLSPAPVTYFTRRNLRVRNVSCGEAHSLVLDRNGVVHACGWSEDGQTGFAAPNPTSSKCAFGVAFRADNDSVAKVSAGSLHSCALMLSGRLYVWGSGEQGQLGLGNKVLHCRSPTIVSALAHMTLQDVVCGGSSVLCLTDSFQAYGWGQGIAGSLGTRSESDEWSTKFPQGTEVICYQPRLLAEVDPLHRVIAGQGVARELRSALTERLPRDLGITGSDWRDTSSES